MLLRRPKVGVVPAAELVVVQEVAQVAELGVVARETLPRPQVVRARARAPAALIRGQR